MNELIKIEKENGLKTLAKIWVDFTPSKVEGVKDRDQAIAVIKDIKQMAKEIDAEKKQLLAPVNEMIAEVKSKFDEPLNALKNAEAKIKATIIQYDDEVKKQIEEQAKREQEEENRLANERIAKLRAEAEAEALFGDINVAEIIEAEAKAIQPLKIAEVEVKQKGRRMVWDFEIEDVSKLPRHYLMPNNSLIRTAIVSAKGQLKIDGVRIFQTPIMAI